MTSKTGKNKNKKTYKKKKYGFSKGMRINELANYYTAFPRRKTAVIPFSEHLKLGTSQSTTAIASGTAQANVFGTEALYRLNSLYEPRQSPTQGIWNQGARALGYNDIAGNWRKYKVIGVSIDVTVQNPKAVTGSASPGLAVGIALQAPQNSQNLTANLYGQADARSGCYVYYLTSAGSRKLRFKRYIPLYKLIGIKKNQFDNDMTSYTAPITANVDAQNTPLLRVAICSTNDASLYQADLDITINYHVELYDKITNAQPLFTYA